MTDLPAGWSWSTVGDVTANVRAVDWSAWPSDTFTYVDIGSIDSASASVATPKTVATTVAPSRARQVIREGDTLFSTVRTYLRNIAFVTSDLDGQIASTGFSVLRPDESVEPRYLYYLVQSQGFIRSVSEQQRGVSYPAVTDKQVRAMPMPLPARPVQERIVRAIEEEFSRIDVAATALGKAAGRHSVLVRQVLESQIPFNGSPGWPMTTVGLAGEVALGRQRAPKFHQGVGMRPYLRVANVFEDRIDSEDVMQMTFTEQEFGRYRLRDGDILLNEGQSPELLGRPAMYRGDPPDIAFTNTLLRFRAYDGVDPEWALLVFRRHLHSGRFRRESRITTNIAHLSAGRFAQVEFPKPPIGEQRRLAESLRAELEAIDRMHGEITAAMNRAAKLKGAVLRAAFEGRLAA